MGPETHFRPVLGDDSVNSASVSRVVFCSGKHYYALAKQREATNSMDTALVRLEVSGLFALVSTLSNLFFGVVLICESANEILKFDESSNDDLISWVVWVRGY